MITELIKVLKSNDIRITPQRKVVIEVIASLKDHHPDIQKIYELSNKQDPNIGIATIYRTMNLMEKLGVVHRLELSDDNPRFELVLNNKKHHHHLIDIDSGEIIEFSNEKLELLKEKIARDLGYKLVDHRLELYGKKDCNK